VALGEGTVQILPQAAAEKFVEGARSMTWPPTYVYWGTDDTCNLATSMFQATMKAVDLLSIANDESRVPPRPNVSYNPVKIFVDAWQRGNDTGNGNIEQRSNIKNRTNFAESIDNAPWYIREPVLLVQGITGLTEVPFLGLALEAPGVISDMLHCDVESVMFCTRHTFSVFTAGLISVIALSIIGTLISFTGIPIVSTLLSVLGFYTLTMFVAFGMSPMCTPLIPSCIFDSLVTDVVYWLPERITIPQSLISCRHDQTISPVPADCIVECDKTPFYFEDATANFGWLLCDFSPIACQKLQQYLDNPDTTFTSIVGIQLTSSIRASLYRSDMVLKSGDTNMQEAFSWCNILSLYRLVPITILVFMAVGAVPLLLAVIIRGVISIVRTALAAYVLTHL
jgi:hypothetical protein